jgi:hypothetical protein
MQRNENKLSWKKSVVCFIKREKKSGWKSINELNVKKIVEGNGYNEFVKK